MSNPIAPMTLCDMQSQRRLYDPSKNEREKRLYYAWDALIEAELGIPPNLAYGSRMLTVILKYRKDVFVERFHK